MKYLLLYCASHYKPAHLYRAAKEREKIDMKCSKDNYCEKSLLNILYKYRRAEAEEKVLIYSGKIEGSGW